MNKLKKLTMTLALLCLTAVGAWADDAYEEITTQTSGTKEYTGEHIKITGTLISSNGLRLASSGDNKVTISSLNGEIITKVEMHIENADNWLSTNKVVSTSGNEAEGTCATGNTITLNNENATEITLSVTDPEACLIDINTWKVYYAPAPTEWDLTPDATRKVWTLEDGMPAGNVTVNVAYFAKAELAMSEDPEPVALAPKAKTGIKANTSDAIIEAGEVAWLTYASQGTLMYYASQSATPVPGYDTEGWSKFLPTAETFAEGKVYVWYYIKGADAPDGVDPSDENTCSDSDISTTAIEVTLGPAPTYAVTLDTDALPAAAEAANWKAKSTGVTTEVNLGTAALEGVKKGETVTARYTGGKKVLGMTVAQTEELLNTAWNVKESTGTFTMLGGDAELTPVYAPTAQFAVVSEQEQKPAAVSGIYAGTTDAIVTAGTVATIGETTTTQGTLMYAAGTDATKVPALTAFSATLPTAKDYDGATTVYVWSYIKGADAPEGETPTAENTFSDSDISATPLTVKLLAPPTLDVTFAKGYSTHYYEESLALGKANDALKFYAVTAVTSEKVTLTEIEAKAIPAETPFVAYNSGAEAITVAMKLVESEKVTNAEQFKGSAEEKSMSAQSGCYVLRNGDSTPTFRLVEGAGTLPAHRCWIELGTASGARALGVEFDGTKTAISTINVDADAAGDWYDLQGRKLQNAPQRKGTYIHNGKTIIIK